MSWTGLALSRGSPLWACAHGLTAHPRYGRCDDCRDYFACNAPNKKVRGMKEQDIPADCPRTGCLNCPRPFDGTCHFFSGKPNDDDALNDEIDDLIRSLKKSNRSKR